MRVCVCAYIHLFANLNANYPFATIYKLIAISVNRKVAIHVKPIRGVYWETSCTAHSPTSLATSPTHGVAGTFGDN